MYVCTVYMYVYCDARIVANLSYDVCMYICTVGEPITSCPADPTVCPSESNLKDISQIGFWMEGAEGDFFFELQSVRAGNGSVF